MVQLPLHRPTGDSEEPKIRRVWAENKEVCGADKVRKVLKRDKSPSIWLPESELKLKIEITDVLSLRAENGVTFGWGEGEGTACAG